MAALSSAPKYTVPGRDIVAVEHPMVVKNIDNALRTFGTRVPLTELFDADDYDGCLPLYLRINDRTSAPILSRNVPTSNVLLKLTVPKRTGRKRKRGSQDAFTAMTSSEEVAYPEDTVKKQGMDMLSHSRLDKPKALLQSLKDNAGRYHIEAIGTIDQTHRFRGLSDFHYSTTHAPFMTKMRESVLSGDLNKIKKFKLDPGKGVKVNGELIPPPVFTDHPLPFNWGYHQNSHMKIHTNEHTGEKVLINRSLPIKLSTLYIGHGQEAPNSPPNEPPDDPILRGLIADLHKILEERPIWTRRAIANRIGQVPGLYLIKSAIQYIGYQFRGGPWRDCIIKFGVDPRTDPKFRIYQTLFFKIFGHGHAETNPDQLWRDKRSEYVRQANQDPQRNSHIFDGKTLSLDGKVWQICDITDPLIQRIASTDAVRETCDIESDGWYCNGTMAKIKAVMRTKISAIQIGREMKDEDFVKTLAVPDDVKRKNTKIVAPAPAWKGLDPAEAALFTELGPNAVGLSGRRKRRVRGIYKKAGKAEKAEVEAQREEPARGTSGAVDPRVQSAMKALTAGGMFDSVSGSGSPSPSELTPDDGQEDGEDDVDDDDNDDDDRASDDEDDVESEDEGSDDGGYGY